MKRSLSFTRHTALILILIGIAAVMRLVPHIPNATPLAAVALFGGAMLTQPWSLVVPMAAMVASDAVIGFYQWQIMVAVYGSFLLTVLMGRWLKANRWPWRVIGASLAASILFYLVTNAAVWRWSGFYPQTFDGLLASYYMALPFFRNTLLGDMVFTYGLFLVAEYAPVIARKLAPKAKAEKALSSSSATN